NTMMGYRQQRPKIGLTVCPDLVDHYRRSKEGMETLLGILATTTTDPALFPYRRAMALYAEDLDRRW
ncbi:hypothetical protein ACVDHI_17435, partial [Aeromonas sp. 25-248]